MYLPISYNLKSALFFLLQSLNLFLSFSFSIYQSISLFLSPPSPSICICSVNNIDMATNFTIYRGGTEGGAQGARAPTYPLKKVLRTL